MRFESPQMVHALWLAAALAVFYVAAFRLRNRALEGLANRELLKGLTPSVSLQRRYVKAILVTLTFVFCTLALMRPQWGFHLEEVRQLSSDILIALDTSKSMLAADIKPNRLQMAKLAIGDFLKKLRGDRIGLIGFAGESFVFSPLTVDYGGFMLALNDLGVNSIPIGGTSIRSAIQEAINVYKGSPSKDKTLILITDGEDHEGHVLDAAKAAKDAGIKIYAIGIGTKEGELIQVNDDSGGKSFVKDPGGNLVKTHLDEETLQRLSTETGGVYVRTSGADLGLDLIYRDWLSKSEKKSIQEKMKKRYDERFQIPLAIAVFLLVVESMLGERRRRVRSVTTKEDKITRDILLIIVLVFALLSSNDAYGSQKSAVIREGDQSYRQGNYTAALEKYTQALKDDPDSDVLNYRTGLAYYRKEDFPKAAEHFTKSLVSKALSVEMRANYNIGNSKFMAAKKIEQADPSGALSHYKEALQYFKRAIELNEKDMDAKTNYELTDKKIQQMLEKSKKQPQQDKNKKQEDKKQDDKSQKDKEQKDSGQKDKQQEGKAQDEKDKGSENKQQEQNQPGKGAKQMPKQDTLAPDKTKKGARPPQSMTKEEAEMLLEGLKDEQSGNVLKAKEKQRGDTPVLKDW
ncbi:MAG: VWA domain-containing protein [Nitrospirae bacterium]|nr:VWA domain-containing protein [Nitrospirota bacterium]